ncbi:hypothetical protein BGZ65_012874, partial [Modicella reniformis]
MSAEHQNAHFHIAFLHIKTTTYLAAAIALVQGMSAQTVWLKTFDGRVWHIDRAM